MFSLNRRQWLTQSGVGFGALALQGLLSREELSATDPLPNNAARSLVARPPQFAPRAKAVIFLFMYGGPSHVDLFDPKPTLTRLHGHLCQSGRTKMPSWATRRRTSLWRALTVFRNMASRESRSLKLIRALPGMQIVCVSFGRCMPRATIMALPCSR